MLVMILLKEKQYCISCVTLLPGVITDQSHLFCNTIICLIFLVTVFVLYCRSNSVIPA